MKHRTSIMLIFRNAEKFLPECLNGIDVQGGVKLLAYDDGSTDNGSRIVREHLLSGADGRLITKTEHLGKTVGIKTLEEKVDTEFVCFVDADDVLLEGAVAKLEATLDGNPKACGAYTDAVYINEDSKIIGPSPYNRYTWSFMNLYRGYVTPHFCLYRTKDYMAVGGCRRELKFAAAYDLKLRLASDSDGWKAKDFVKVSKPLVKIRKHPDQISRASRSEQFVCANSSRESVSDYVRKLMAEGGNPFSGK